MSLTKENEFSINYKVVRWFNFIFNTSEQIPTMWIGLCKHSSQQLWLRVLWDNSLQFTFLLIHPLLYCLLKSLENHTMWPLSQSTSPVTNTIHSNNTLWPNFNFTYLRYNIKLFEYWKIISLVFGSRTSWTICFSIQHRQNRMYAQSLKWELKKRNNHLSSIATSTNCLLWSWQIISILYVTWDYSLAIECST